MKANIAYYLLILYTIAICKPVFPILQDKLAHTFCEADHLATIHHHHGNDHSEKEIAIAEQKENNDKHPGNTKISEPVSVHLVVQILYKSLKPTMHKQTFAKSIFNISAVSIDKLYPPPKSC